ncbi:GerMN domain-containing protein [Cohnella zeiphila]|uniref:GerMN domain-containing protein n=1 Tax=Cohnella zeiphila TaxID=2761120 RepID=A0A7X0STC9_9BACL|nr:GerMN domain-containing protein [Cohnella zeiphila]MBB6733533.1 GerMN domain-containing protein [Cohnella zeiphila]
MKPKIGRKATRRLLAAMLLLPLAAGCSAIPGAKNASQAIDPPPSDVEQTMLQASGDEAQTTMGGAIADQTGASASGAAAGAAAAGADALTVYLLDRNGYVAPMTFRSAPADQTDRSVEETALAWMTKDDSLADQLPPGFSPILPQGTKFKSVKVDAKSATATIDFASPFPSVPAGQERKMVEALVWTMTEIPGIDKVVLQVDGQPLHELPASKLPLSDVLTRDIGINVEQAAGTVASRSMGVTLYFSARSEEGEGYFVPVTRLIERSSDRQRAALEELIKGPQSSDELQPVLTSNVTVEGLTQSDDTVNVALNDPGWSPDMTVSSDTVEAVVLTVTEASGEAKARITMNGDASFKDANNQTYDEPVERPVAINPLAG